jgi:hypothetical protein
MNARFRIPCRRAAAGLVPLLLAGCQMLPTVAVAQKPIPGIQLQPTSVRALLLAGSPIRCSAEGACTGTIRPTDDKPPPGLVADWLKNVKVCGVPVESGGKELCFDVTYVPELK